jgi:hypothetical protein
MTTTRTHFTFRVDTWTPDGEAVDKDYLLLKRAALVAHLANGMMTTMTCLPTRTNRCPMTLISGLPL